MIKVYGGTNEEVNREVRRWLRYWGFYWYPHSDFMWGLKESMGKAGDMLVVADEVETMVVVKATWKMKEVLYWRLGIPEDAQEVTV